MQTVQTDVEQASIVEITIYTHWSSELSESLGTSVLYNVHMIRAEHRTGGSTKGVGRDPPQREPLTNAEIGIWLEKRIGEDERLVVQANLPGRKYTPVAGGPDIAAAAAAFGWETGSLLPDVCLR